MTETRSAKRDSEPAGEPDSSRQRMIHYLFLLALCLLTAWLVYWITEPYLKPIITAIILAVVYYPVHLHGRGPAHSLV